MNRWRELRKEFLACIDVSEKTVTVYKKTVKYFFNWLEGKSNLEITTQLLKEYKGWLKEERSANTVYLYLTGLKRFFDFCVERDVLIKNPINGIKIKNTNRGHKRRNLSKGEVRELLDTVDTSTIKGRRDFLIINLMVRCGLRRVEIQRANIDDIEERDGHKLLWVQGKGRVDKEQFVVLTEPVQKALKAWLKVRPKAKSKALIVSLGHRNWGGRLVEKSIYMSVKTYLEKLGLNSEKVTPHSLRHSFITLAIKAGVPLARVRIAARHKSILTTQVYFHEHQRLSNPVEGFINI